MLDLHLRGFVSLTTSFTLVTLWFLNIWTLIHFKNHICFKTAPQKKTQKKFFLNACCVLVICVFLCCSVCLFLYGPICHGALCLQHSVFEHHFNLYYVSTILLQENYNQCAICTVQETCFPNTSVHCNVTGNASVHFDHS